MPNPDPAKQVQIAKIMGTFMAVTGMRVDWCKRTTG